MTAHLGFWSLALANLFVIAVLFVRGVGLARRRDFARHRFCMTLGMGLIGLFLLAYVGKLFVLGREDLSTWSDAAVALLRFHELCVGAMLVFGGAALLLGRRLAKTRLFSGDSNDPAPSPGLLRWHRAAGWTAVVGAFLGFVTATFVLAGMFGRA